MFGAAATPVLSQLRWGERAVAHLLDHLLWTTPKDKGGARERVHYGPLDVEDLGRVYEALLELEPGISSQPMCRLRRQKLEVVVPIVQGEKYRESGSGRRESGIGNRGGGQKEEMVPAMADDSADDRAPNPEPRAPSPVQWIEEIPAGRFYLRVGLGRKASGSYYTPQSLVRFLVRETLESQVAERTTRDDPQPGEILKLKVLDPAMGSGHFLVEACRFLGQHLYEAARLCDEKATALKRQAEKAGSKREREKLQDQARTFRQRVIDLPDPDAELVRYMPSGLTDGEPLGVSQRRTEALCRRIVAMHCLYGVDKNPLAVELAKLALWLESHAEGIPLTFLDHRLVVGDSLTGPFWDKLIMCPAIPRNRWRATFHQGLALSLKNRLAEALSCVRHLEATAGASMAEVRQKQRIKAELDEALRPFRVIAAAWSGGVMLGPKQCDDLAYSDLLASVAKTGEIPQCIESERLRAMIARGLGLDLSLPLEEGEGTSTRDQLYTLLASSRCVPALPYDLAFPEVFFPSGVLHERHGFDAALGNPPWDAVRPKSAEFFGSLDFDALAGHTKREREAVEKRLLEDPRIARSFAAYVDAIEGTKRAYDVLYRCQKVMIEGDLAGRYLDQYRVFLERKAQLLRRGGQVGVIVPAAFRANAGAVGVRRLYMLENHLRFCYTLRNTKLLFEISAGMQFCLIVARFGNGAASDVEVAFDVEDDAWLFSEPRDPPTLGYPIRLIQATGGPHLTIVNLPSQADVELMLSLAAGSAPFSAQPIFSCLRFQTNPAALNATKDAWRLESTEEACREDPRHPGRILPLLDRGFVPLHEKGTFSRYDYREQQRPRYLVDLHKCEIEETSSTNSVGTGWSDAVPSMLRNRTRRFSQ